MRIWIDLANSPHVPFFRALIPEFTKRGHEVEITVRDFAETVPLAIAAGLNAEVIGEHGGKELRGKAGNLLSRARSLRSWARERKFDLAVSHNSYSQIVAARLLRLKCVTLMDYEYQPANHLAFRLAGRVVVPQAFPDNALRKFGAGAKKVKRYRGTKEDVYLADFKADPEFPTQLENLGITRADILVVVRPPASEALYHRFENELFDELIRWLELQPGVKIVLLPRNDQQRVAYAARPRLILPAAPLDGANLIASSDLVISAGGTMNREAAALGTPAVTIFAGKWAAVDEELCRTGRLRRLNSREEFGSLSLVKKQAAQPSGASNLRSDVADLILVD